ncbi:hypothetical protein AgCh_000812 [Apium graveolens]
MWSNQHRQTPFVQCLRKSNKGVGAWRTRGWGTGLDADMEDYGFEYSDEEQEEQDVDIENQYYNSKDQETAKNQKKIVEGGHTKSLVRLVQSTKRFVMFPMRAKN